MSDVWERVRSLEGKTLRTLARGKPFKITAVSADRVEFVPKEGSGTVRWFPREDVELLAGLGLG